MDDTWVQSFHVAKNAHDALDDAQVYLEGAGIVAPRLHGQVERQADSLVMHHGRIETKIQVEASGDDTKVTVTRTGQAPLEETRRWFYGAGLGGFMIAWLLAVYNENASQAFNPLLTILVFFIGIFSMMVVLYVADRSMERRSEGLVLSLEDAMAGNAMQVLRREMQALNRVGSIVNGGLGYFALLMVAYLLHVILLSPGVREGIDSALTIEVMRYTFTLPIIPALLFGGMYYVINSNRYQQKLQEVQDKFAA